jgi:erythromycin esterase-like protein
MHYHNAFEAVRSAALPLGGGMHDYDHLIELVAERTFVLLGESTHGTEEFYRMRAEISRRLIEECGFDAIAVEADWPDAYRINRYVQGQGDALITEAFADFQRFPKWMWRNREMLSFITWQAEHNQRAGSSASVGFYGLDLYSLYRSASAVTEYLERVDLVRQLRHGVFILH